MGVGRRDFVAGNPESREDPQTLRTLDGVIHGRLVCVISDVLVCRLFVEQAVDLRERQVLHFRSRPEAETEVRATSRW